MNNPPRPTCHVCSHPTKGPIRNGVGGLFWMCPTCQGTNGRNLTWNLRDGVCNNDPRVVSRASKLRGRCISLKEETIAYAVFSGHDKHSIQEFLSTFGVIETRRLLGLAA